MPYATQADLETRFGSVELAQLSDRTNGSVIDAAVVALFDDLDSDRGDSLVAFGWAMAEDLAKLG